jgi:hypothetical protein
VPKGRFSPHNGARCVALACLGPSFIYSYTRDPIETRPVQAEGAVEDGLYLEDTTQHPALANNQGGTLFRPKQGRNWLQEEPRRQRIFSSPSALHLGGSQGPRYPEWQSATPEATYRRGSCFIDSLAVDPIREEVSFATSCTSYRTDLHDISMPFRCRGNR